MNDDEARIREAESRLRALELFAQQARQRAVGQYQNALLLTQVGGYSSPPQGMLSLTIWTIGCTSLPGAGVPDVPVTCLDTGVTVTPASGSQQTRHVNIPYFTSSSSQIVTVHFNADPTGIQPRFVSTTRSYNITIPANATSYDAGTIYHYMGITPGYHCCTATPFPSPSPVLFAPLQATLYVTDAIWGRTTLNWDSSSGTWVACVTESGYTSPYGTQSGGIAWNYSFSGNMRTGFAGNTESPFPNPGPNYYVPNAGTGWDSCPVLDSFGHPLLGNTSGDQPDPHDCSLPVRPSAGPDPGIVFHFAYQIPVTSLPNGGSGRNGLWYGNGNNGDVVPLLTITEV